MRNEIHPLSVDTQKKKLKKGCLHSYSRIGRVYAQVTQAILDLCRLKLLTYAVTVFTNI